MTTSQELGYQIEKLAQKNQAQLGKFWGLDIPLSNSHSKLISNLTQKYTELLYLTRSLNEEAVGQSNYQSKVAVINKKLSEIDPLLKEARSLTGIPQELKDTLNSIQQTELRNKVKEFADYFSLALKDLKNNSPGSDIQKNVSNLDSKKKSNKPGLNNLDAPNWGIRFTVVEQSRNLTPLLRRAENLADPRREREPFNIYRGPAAPLGKSFYMTLLPAMASNLNLQGARDVPNVMPGLNFKIIPNIAKLKFPGFQPAYQNLGIDTVLCNLVGCFTGADGIAEIKNGIEKPINKTENFKGQLLPYQGSSAFFKSGSNEEELKQVVANLDSYRNFQEFYQMTVLQGKEVTVEINLAKTSGAAINLADDKNLRAGNGNPKFKAVIKSMEVYHSRSDRTWYTLQLEVSDFGLAGQSPINLTNKLSERIKAAQEAKNKLEQDKKAAEAQKLKEAEDFLKNKKAEQHDLKDGRKLFKIQDCETSSGPGDLSIPVCKGDRWFLQDDKSLKEVTTDPTLEELKKLRKGQVTAGDALSLLGRGFGCGTGISSIIATGGVGLLAGGVTLIGCGSLIGGFYDLYTGNTGKSLGEGALELGLSFVPFADDLGKAGLSVIKTLPGASKAGQALTNIPGSGKVLEFTTKAGGAVTNKVGETYNFLNRRIEIFPKNTPVLEGTKNLALNTANSISSGLNNAVGTIKKTPQVLSKAGISNPVGQVGVAGVNTAKTASQFLDDAGVIGKSIQGTKVTTNSGSVIEIDKIEELSGGFIKAFQSNQVKSININSVKQIQLPNGEVWIP